MQVISDEHTSTGNIQSGYAGRDDQKCSPSADYFALDIFNSTLLSAESILEFRERTYVARNRKIAVGDRTRKDVPPNRQITALV
jgi:hypothetical protein